MSNVITHQEESHPISRFRAIGERLAKVCIAYSFVGVTIGCVGAEISEPGIVAWTLVMGVFGCMIGVLGGRAIDVCVASIGVACLLAANASFMHAIAAPDAIAHGLLMGSIAGGMLRPWCSLSFGLFSLIRQVIWSRTQRVPSDLR